MTMAFSCSWRITSIRTRIVWACTIGTITIISSISTTIATASTTISVTISATTAKSTITCSALRCTNATYRTVHKRICNTSIIMQCQCTITRKTSAGTSLISSTTLACWTRMRISSGRKSIIPCIVRTGATPTSCN